MTEYTAREFKIKYKQKPEEVFDLSSCMSDEIRRALYTSPGKEVVRLVLGEIESPNKTFYYCVRVIWVLVQHKLEIYGRFTHVWLFDDVLEQELFRLNKDEYLPSKELPTNEN